ncbi:MAG: fibronectin type III domain-containing protein [Chthoniobacterales bacterium]
MNSNPKPRVSLAFANLRAALLLLFGRNVVTMMTGNPAFATPFPTLATVTTALNNLETTAEAALDRSKVAIANRNANYATLLSLLRQLAAYVQSHSVDDVAVLVSSGFEPTKGSTPIGPLPTPPAAFLRQGPTSGSIRARTASLRGAYSYNWRVALASAPSTYLEEAQTTAVRYTFEGLTPGQTYIVQVSAVGAAGQTSWSAITSMMVV